MTVQGCGEGTCSHSSWSPRAVAIHLFLLQALWTGTAWSQRSGTMFGASTSAVLGGVPRQILFIPPGNHASACIALVLNADPAIRFLTVDSSGTFHTVDSTVLSGPVEALAVAPSGDKVSTTCAAVLQGSSEVAVWKRPNRGTQPILVPVQRAQRMKLADINGDGRPDILLFGKTTAGVAVWINSGKDAFLQGPVLFPDISVSDIAVTDLNGDRIPDVFVVDWLSNKLHVMYGITRLVFSSQMTIDLPGEPGTMALTSVSPGHRVRIALSLPRDQKVLVLEGDGYGGFPIIASPASLSTVGEVKFVESNGLPDIVASTSRGIMVLPARDRRSYGPPQFLGTGMGDGCWFVADIDGNTLPELVAINSPARTITVSLNAQAFIPASWPYIYAGGLHPEGLALWEREDEGLPDLVVVNGGSRNVSVFSNLGEGRIKPEFSVNVAEHPTQVVPLRSDGRRMLAIAHPGIDRLSLVVADSPGDVRVHVIPTGENPVIAGEGGSRGTGRIEFPVAAEDNEGREKALSVFEEFSDGHFVEHTVRTQSSATITAITAGRRSGPWPYVILFAESNRALRRITIYSALMASDGKAGPVNAVARFADSTNTPCFLKFETSTASARNGIVVMGEPRNCVGVFTLDSSSVSGGPIWVTDVHATDAGAILYRDVDGDGRGDLVVHDAARRALLLYRGKPDLGFLPPQMILECPPRMAFAVGPLWDKNSVDIAVADPVTSLISLVRDPFRGRTP